MTGPVLPLIFVAACSLQLACVDALDPTYRPESNRDVDGMALFLLIKDLPPDSSLACDTESVGNTRTTVVKATSGTTYTYCDLGSLSTVDEFNASWDLRFQRFRISSNSGTVVTDGTTGTGGTCNTGSTDFASVTSTTACSIQADKEVSSSVGGSGGTDEVTYDGSEALKDWYNYNGSNHVLSAKDDVYLIRSSDGTSFYKLQMLDYYDEAGTSGYPTFRWESL